MSPADEISAALSEFDQSDYEQRAMEVIREFDAIDQEETACAAVAAADVADTIAAIIAEPAVSSSAVVVAPSAAVLAFNSSMDAYFEKNDESFKETILSMIGAHIQNSAEQSYKKTAAVMNAECTRLIDHVDYRLADAVKRLADARAAIDAINTNVSSTQTLESAELLSVLIRHFELAACVLEDGERIKKRSLQQIVKDVAACETMNDAVTLERKRQAVVLVSLHSLLVVAQRLTRDLHKRNNYTLLSVRNMLRVLSFRGVLKQLVSSKGEYHAVRDAPFLVRGTGNKLVFETAEGRAAAMGAVRTAAGRKRSEPKAEFMEIRLGLFCSLVNENAAKIAQFAINSEWLFTEHSKAAFKSYQKYLRGEDYDADTAGGDDASGGDDDDDDDDDDAVGDDAVEEKSKKKRKARVDATRKRQKLADSILSSSGGGGGSDDSEAEQQEQASEPDPEPAAPLPAQNVEFVRFFLFKHLNAAFSVPVMSDRDLLTKRRTENAVAWSSFVAVRPASTGLKLYVNARAFETLIAYLTKADDAQAYCEQADLRLLEFMSTVQRSTNIPDVVKAHLFVEETHEKTLDTLRFAMQDMDDMLVCSGIAFYEWYSAMAKKYSAKHTYPAAVFVRSFIELKEMLTEKYKAQREEQRAGMARAVEKQQQRMKPIAMKFPAAIGAGRCTKRLAHEKAQSNLDDNDE